MYQNRISTVGERVKIALKERNMKGATLCRMSKTPQSSLSLYLSGSYEPKQERVYAMAEALNVDVAWLLGYDVPMGHFHKEENTRDELNEYLEELRTRPEMRMLFSISKGATKEDIEKAVAIIEALRKTNG